MKSPCLPGTLCGFLHELDSIDTGTSKSILVRGRFDVDRYREEMFQSVDIEVPPSLATAGPQRRAEFLAGRAIARQALLALGQDASDIPIGLDRAPIWPAGSAGSISHASGHCTCFAVAGDGWNVGVDIEVPPNAEALHAILTVALNRTERALITEQSALPLDVSAALVFSAKEALFKALYPSVRHYFGFEIAEIRTPPANGYLRLYLTEMLAANLPRGISYNIRYQTGRDHVLTWLAIPRVRHDTIPLQ